MILYRARELLVDYFAYDNEHKTSDEFWHNYFIFFSYIAAEEHAQKYESVYFYPLLKPDE